ncbi:MAG: glycosyltransferase family 2 protein [Flavobacteriales bacterium]|nr:glycosyltransferase family 2 protein [Flavobacteriales bacterium]
MNQIMQQQKKAKTLNVLVVIPCYNEEEAIADVVKEVMAQDIQDVKLTALVINDKSTDDSLKVLVANKINHVSLPVNLGIGGAVQTGYKFAFSNGFDIAIQLDGDGQHRADQLVKIISPIKEGEAEVVIGSRYLTKEGFQSSTLRRFGINFFRRVIKMLTGEVVKDSTSGFRALNIDALRVVNQYYPDTYPEPEAIVLYTKHSLRIKEVPVVMRERQGGVSSITGASSVYYMFKVFMACVFAYLRPTTIIDNS